MYSRGKCVFCGKWVGEEFYCPGCEQYICKKCGGKPPIGKHNAEEHRAKENNMQREGRCYFCDTWLDERFYCYGCGQFVCSGCDTFTPVGKHSIGEHRVRRDSMGKPNFVSGREWWCLEAKEEVKEKHFICYVEGTDGGKRFRHYTLQSAQTEAERLARLTGKKTHIYEWKGSCQVEQQPIKWEIPR